jgi:hypothetical protein
VIRGAAAAFGIAAAATVIVAWPILRSPTELVYGHEIAGRHYDAYAVMQQFAGAPVGIEAQPLTDRLGSWLARIMDPVAAYNLLVLLSFPLTAAATYALARYLVDSHAAALIAAMAFTFAPPRLAHAAYHPHIVQTQWLALYLLALFALIDRPSWLRAGALVLASATLVLSNAYGGLVGAVLTPVAIAAYAWTRREPTGLRALAVTLGATAAIGAAGAGLLAVRVPEIFARPSPYAFRPNEVGLYSARWWAYLTPPVDHPVWGAWSAAVFTRAGETVSLVEQQLSISYALLLLAAAGLAIAAARWRIEPWRRAIVAISAIGAVALLVSLGPASGSCEGDAWAPACLLFRIVPMFRSYARFGLAVHLTLAIAAGAGAVIIASRSRAGRSCAVCLLAIAAVEYAPLPWRMHDVLPTRGHRWLAGRSDSGSVLDCMKASPSVANVPWLMKRPIAFLSAATPTCADPRLGGRLAMLQYSYVLVHRGSREAPPDTALGGLTPVADFPDSRVFAVPAAPPRVAVLAAEGFFDYEYDRDGWWQWMTARGRWIVRAASPRTDRVRLSLRLQAVGSARTLDVTLDGQPAGRFPVGTTLEEFVAGPWDLTPGTHTVAFAASGPPFRPSEAWRTSDPRELTIMFRAERWQ